MVEYIKSYPCQPRKKVKAWQIIHPAGFLLSIKEGGLNTHITQHGIN
jgi:hypothetical protein